MTGRTEPPDLKRHLRQLERRVEQIERANRTKRTTRPQPTVGNELLLGDAGEDRIHAHTHDGDGYIHFLADGETFHGNLYQATPGTRGTTRQAQIVFVTSQLAGGFQPEMRMTSQSDDGTLPSAVSIDAGNGKIDLNGDGGVYWFNRNLPAVRGTSAGVDVSTTQFFIQCGSTVVDTDTAGDATIPFPSVFPTAVVSVTVSNGDNAPNGAIVNTHNKTASQFKIRARNHDGTVMDGLIRIEWIAVGY